MNLWQGNFKVRVEELFRAVLMEKLFPHFGILNKNLMSVALGGAKNTHCNKETDGLCAKSEQGAKGIVTNTAYPDFAWTLLSRYANKQHSWALMVEIDEKDGHRYLHPIFNFLACFFIMD